MLSPNEDFALMSERRRDLLQAARMHQLYRETESHRAQLGERLMVLLADLMISGGEKLKARSSVSYTIEAQN